MKKNNRKGFTIVELVIVIAVIAILAAVLIPTFSNMIDKANDSATLQEARNIYTEYTSEYDYVAGGAPDQNVIIKVDDDEYIIVKEGQIQETVYESLDKADDEFAAPAEGKAWIPDATTADVYVVGDAPEDDNSGET